MANSSRHCSKAIKIIKYVVNKCQNKYDYRNISIEYLFNNTWSF